jgi:hypothetical protein
VSVTIFFKITLYNFLFPPTYAINIKAGLCWLDSPEVYWFVHLPFYGIFNNAVVAEIHVVLNCWMTVNNELEKI